MTENKRNPLNEMHLAGLNRLLSECALTREYLSKCERCGLDVEEEKMKNNQQIDVAEKIKKEFFPNEP